MTAVFATSAVQDQDAEKRLADFGLSTEIIHSCMGPGLSRANNRSALALNSTPGTDIYNDGMEQFAQRLYDMGWKRRYVDGQPRMIHPDGIIAFTIGAAKNAAGSTNARKPPTTIKGEATRKSLDVKNDPMPLFFLESGGSQPKATVQEESVPLWILLYTRTELGLYLELSRPAGMTKRIINEWSERILIDFLGLISEDFSVFIAPEEESYEFSIPSR